VGVNILNYIKIFFLTFPLFLAIDFTWLGLIAKKFYDNSLIHFDRTLRWQAAALVYILIVSAVIIIAVPKYLESGKLSDALIWGAFTGLIIYGTYDLTNMSILTDWSWKVVIVDMIWGMIICGSVGVIASLFSRIVL
jgi:uncharacterized membrane protein